MLKPFFFSAIVSSVNGASWNYATNNGADWPTLGPINNVKNECGGKYQSPIDLPSRMPSDKIIRVDEDRFNKIYSNQRVNIKVEWNGHTSQTAVNKPDQDLQTFQSWYAWELGGPSTFTGIQFHFHHGSEHTIDGKRHDLEMHTVHLPEDPRGDIKYAAMGIMFSVNDYNIVLPPEKQKIIDNFFDSLSWSSVSSSQPSPTVS
jgi:carbonic anhydrase